MLKEYEVGYTARCKLFSADGTPFGTTTLAPDAVIAKITVPDKVLAGGTFATKVQWLKGTKNGPIDLFAGNATFGVNLDVTGGTPNPLALTGGPNTATIPANTLVPIPDMTGIVTATAPVGGTVDVSISELRITGSQGIVVVTKCALVDPTAVAGFAKVAVVAAPPATTTTTTTTTTTSVPGPTSTTSTTTTTAAPAPTSTSSTSTSTSTTSTSTTSTTVPLSQTAVVKEYEVSFTTQCRLFNSDGTPFGTAPIAPVDVIAKVTAPDKVGVGGGFTATVSWIKPTVNGPIDLFAGNATFQVDVGVKGGTPNPLVLKGGPNTATIPALAPVPVPIMAGNVTATAAAGSDVELSLGALTVTGSQGVVVKTVCTAVDPTKVAAIAKVAVVAGVVTGVSTTTTAPAVVAGATGFATCDEAKAARRGVIPKSDPAYNASLDADGDGLACEANEGKVAGTTTTRSGARLATTGGETSTPIKAGTVLLAVGFTLLTASQFRRPRRARNA